MSELFTKKQLPFVFPIEDKQKDTLNDLGGDAKTQMQALKKFGITLQKDATLHFTSLHC